MGSWGCDIVQAPYVDLNSLPADERCVTAAEIIPAFPAGATFEKRVLVEKMTGHKCGNCPRATKELDSYVETYGDRLVVVKIHAGPLASFTPTASKYFSDYTTEVGDEIFQDLNTTDAVPFGLIDRVFQGTNALAWADQIASRLDEPATAGLRIFNCFEADSLSINTVIDVKYLVNASNRERLVVQLIEDNVEDWQKDYTAPNGTPDIEAYLHQDVLRASINGTWGQPVSTEEITADQVFRQTYSFDLDPAFDPAQCKIVAYLFDFATKTVRQVAEQSVE